MSELRIDRLSKTFVPGGSPVVDDLSLQVSEGQLLVLLGPSGCGKTTLLRCVAGLERPDAGTIEIAGETMFGRQGRTVVPTHKRGIGMVFQNYALWPHMTVEQIVSYPLRVRGVKRDVRRKQAREALALVECEELAERIPSAISGGQQQRVALARALVAEPRLLLFDEPLSNLDYRLRAELRQKLRDLHRRLGFAGLYVTHDQTEAMQLGTTVAVLREGRVEQLADPATLFGRPRSSYVARFLGIGNRIEVARSGEGWALRGGGDAVNLLAGHQVPANDYDLYLRSTDLVLSGIDSGPEIADSAYVRGVVKDVVYNGENTDWLVEVGTAVVTASARTGTWPYRTNDQVHVMFRNSSALLYERDDAGKLVEVAPARERV